MKCTSVCKDYVEEKCVKLSTAPYVCNGCEKLRRCTLKKSIYTASYSQKQYEIVLKESRTGIIINETETKRLDKFISPLIRKGHSIHHICINNIDTIMCSEKTIYNYVDYNIFSARNIDLPRKIRYRPRKKSSKRFKVDKACRINRTYKNFLEYMNNNPDAPVVQMDTVEGRKGRKVLLTIHFLQTHFMLAYLRDSNTSKSVTNVFESLYNDLGNDIFKQLFILELTDNGSEFSNPLAIEYNKQGNKRTMVFYCDPSAPFQKGAVENNHEMIRRIIPKGHSFDHLNQNDIDFMMNNINSYGRKILNNKSPYELFKLIHGINVLDTLNAQLIPPNEIILTPKLFKNH